MKGDIYRLSEDDTETFSGNKLGTIVCIDGECVIHTDDMSLREILEPLLEQTITVRKRAEINGMLATITKKVSKADPEFLTALKFRLLEYGLWMEIDE